MTSKRLPVTVANDLSNLINQMLLGKEAYQRAQDREPPDPGNLQYWYDYLHAAETQLEAIGIHLAAPLE